MPMRTACQSIALAAAALCAACTGPEPRPTARDDRGNYATTSTFKSTQRTDFTSAMRAGLEDYDRRLRELESRASKLGQSAIDELHVHMPELSKKRTTMVNLMSRLEAALDADWPARREETQAAYDDLRAGLDLAYERVLK